MRLSGAEIVVKLLERQGIEIISGIPGGANLPIYNALYDSGIRHVLARHEQGAGFIAQGMARSTGKAAVCFGTSGPGATNLITAIADAKSDSVPIIVITGQVPTSMIGTDAFQEVDTYGLTVPITKHNFQVRTPKELFDILPESFSIAQSGRQGPVVIDIPKDVQSEVIEFEAWPEPWTPRPAGTCDCTLIGRIADMIQSARQPVLYIGGGIVAADASDDLKTLAERNSIPVASTLMGLGCLPRDHPLFLGLLGMHGARYTNIILEEADLILALGVRFDDRATGKAGEFCKNASIIHIDIDRPEIDKIKPTSMSLAGDVGGALRALVPLVPDNRREKWNARVQALKDKYSNTHPEHTDISHPFGLLKHISEEADHDAIITTDVGQHQMWVAQAYPFRSPRSFLTSGGLGTMGFGVPAAIGAALANPGRQVVCISGDGSFLMNIQELATMAEQNLNLTTIIMNNNHLGLVRQQQELFYNKRIFASKFESCPDFAAIAGGFGIAGFDLGKEDNPAGTLALALKKQGPAVVNVPIDSGLNVYPMVPPGAANHEMIGGECHA